MKKENKTKAELLKEIEENEKNISDLHAQIDKLERYKQYEECAGELKAAYDSFILAGFDGTQAFKLVCTMLTGVFNKL